MATKYIITLADPAQLPDLFKDKFMIGYAEPRVAFVGRSNVGKSSLINALMQERVARVSATPGKTRAIHFFLWPQTKRIVADLPGYGFAKVSKAEQHTWSNLIGSYFEADSALSTVFILFDSRHGPTPTDLETLLYFQAHQAPIQIVMTKFDQLKRQTDRARRKKEVLATLEPYGFRDTDLFWVSIKNQKSLAYLRDAIIKKEIP